MQVIQRRDIYKEEPQKETEGGNQKNWLPLLGCHQIISVYTNYFGILLSQAQLQDRLSQYCLHPLVWHCPGANQKYSYSKD